ncbi:MAG: hypothetical protein QNL62_01980, partial [Gammaproteobacteria bacterium]|nr:hypothetical protein [Gammaproteobacteria bacterium]
LVRKDPNLSQGPIMTKGNLHQYGALPQIDEAPLIQSFDIVITSWSMGLINTMHSSQLRIHPYAFLNMLL